MKQKSLSLWLKAIIIGMALCGLVIFLAVLPSFGSSLVYQYPEFSNRYWPWLTFLWIAGLPCFAVLFFAWRIAESIGNDRSFSKSNATLLKWIAWMAAGDALCFFMGNVLLLLLNMSHPGVALLSLIVVFAGVCIAVAAAALSHLVLKATDLQEQSDWTI